MLSRLLALLRNLLNRQTVEDSLDEEIESCFQLLVDRKIEAGLDAEQARREARLELGGSEQLKERVREVRMGNWIATFGRDIRYGVRTLRRDPGFSVVAVITLALGIGANSAVFSVINGVLLRPLPYPQPGRLVRIYQQNSPTNRFGLSVVDFQALMDQQDSLESLAGVARSRGVVEGPGSPQWVRVAEVTPGFFATLGVAPAIGRSFLPGEAGRGDPGVVISNDFGQRYFGDSREAIGRTLNLDGVVMEVVGVLPSGLRKPAGVEADLWPILRLPEPARRGPFFLIGIGRLKAGTSLDHCRKDLASISRRIFPIWASTFQDETARLTPVSLREAMIGDVGTGLLLVFGAVTLVLMIALTNVVNLLLARSSRRQREIVLRLALGAGKWRLARQLVAEGLVLSTLGAVGGLLSASAGLPFLLSMIDDLPRVHEVSLDSTAVAFTSLIAVLAGVAFGLAPLLFGRDPDLVASLKGAGRAASPGETPQIARSLLVAGEFALAVPLLVAAGLLLTSLSNLQQVDPGFDTAGIVTARLTLPTASYPDAEAVRRFWDETLRELKGLPGMLAVGISSGAPPDEPGIINNFDLVDKPVEPGGRQPIAPWLIVTPGFFEALNLPLLTGRVFDTRDHPGSSPVAVVSQSWAEHFYPGESAIGRRMISGGCTSCTPTTVVGVVGDIKLQGLDGGAQSVYIPFQQAAVSSVTVLARVEGSSSSALRLLTRTLQARDPGLPLAEAATMEERLSASTAEPRHWTLLLGVFAGLAVVLAAIGVFGVLSYYVNRQRREIGIRMALGADRTDLIMMVVKRGMTLALGGLVTGALLSIYATQWMEALLFQVKPGDPRVLIGVCTLLLVVALAGCYLPGRRAAGVDPREALSSE